MLHGYPFILTLFKTTICSSDSHNQINDENYRRWPGSFYEFHKVIGPLANPEKYGNTDSRYSFHVVVPSLPG